MMIIEQMLNNAPNPLLHIADVSGSALFQGDCLDIMPLIPDKSVQLILADLPYGTTACKWDSIIDLPLLWKQYKRIIKDNGAIVLTASQPFTTKLISSNYEMFHHELIWNKRFAANYAQAKTHPQKIHESILVFGNKPKYYPQMTLRDKPIKKGKNGGAEMYGGVSGLGREDYNGKVYTHKYPESIIEYSSRSEKRGLQPTQKPLELMKYLISTYSNENDIVLDNTMGSGTTCLAAKELNRKYIGIEKDFNIFQTANNRINKHDCKCDVCFQFKSIIEAEDNHFYCKECSAL
jgi:site-specific DNA-methyltransferase (adenine-specific)